MDSHRVKIIQSTKWTDPIKGENSTQHTSRTDLLKGKEKKKKKLLIPQSGRTLKRVKYVTSPQRRKPPRGRSLTKGSRILVL